MARETATRLEQFFAFGLVTLGLRRNFTGEAVLPEVSGHRPQILLTFFAIVFKAPELRHLGAGTEAFGIFQPERNPFLAQLQLHIFKVWADLFLILKQV